MRTNRKDRIRTDALRAAADAEGFNWLFLAQLAAIVLPVLIVYWPALRGGWIGDDNLLVAQNTVLEWKPGHTWEGLIEILRGDKAADYYPVTTFLYWVEQRLFGWNTFGFHLVNVVLHAIDSVLVWVVLRRLRIPGAWLAGLIFAVHPVHVESVAWISELKNVLSMLFYLLAFMAFLNFEAGEKRRPFLNFVTISATITGGFLAAGAIAEFAAGGVHLRNYFIAMTGVPLLLPINYAAQALSRRLGPRYHYLAALFFFLIGVLSKAHIVIFPLVVLLYVWWRNDFGWLKRGAPVLGAEARFLKIINGFLAAIAAAIAIGAIWYLSFARSAESEHALGRHLPLLIAVAFFCALVGLIAVVRGDRFNRSLIWVVPFLLLALLIGAVEVCFQHGRGLGGDWIEIGDPLRRLANGGKAVWWYIGKVFVPMRLVAIYPGWGFGSTRLIEFLPLILLLVMTAVLFLYRRSWARAPFLVFAYFVIGVLPVLGFFKMAVAWQNTIVTDHFQYISDISAIALFSATVMWAWRRWRGSVRIALGAVIVLMISAMCVYSWDRSNIYRNEDVYWTDILKKNADSWQGQFRVASKLMEEGKFAEAAERLSRAVELRPNHPDLRNALGLAYSRLGQFDQGIQQYKTALQLQKGRISPAAVRSSITIRMNFANAVAAVANSATTSAESLQMQGVPMAAEAQRSEAHRGFEKAVALYREVLLYEPNHAAAHRNLGLILGQLGDLAAAEEHLRRVLELVPNEPIARELLEEIEKRRRSGTVP